MTWVELSIPPDHTFADEVIIYFKSALAKDEIRRDKLKEVTRRNFGFRAFSKTRVIRTTFGLTPKLYDSGNIRLENAAF